MNDITNVMLYGTRHDIRDSRVVIKSYANVNAMVHDTTLEVGDVVYVEGYYYSADGGGGKYVITSSPTIISEELDNGLYATTLCDIENGYLDIRCLGAREDEDVSPILDKAFKFSNQNYVTPIKIVGNYTMESTITVKGSLCLFGEQPDNRVMLSTDNIPDFGTRDVSSITVTGGITAIQYYGNGATDAFTSYKLSLDNLKLTGSASGGRFIQLMSYGQSRPCHIKGCRISRFDEFLYCKLQAHTVDYSLFNQFEIANNNVDLCTWFLYCNLPAGELGFSNVNIHDNIIEQGGGELYLDGLYGFTSIKNNNFENSSGTMYFRYLDGTMEFVGNYLETGGNTLHVNINSANINKCSLKIGGLNMMNSTTAELDVNVRNFVITEAPATWQEAIHMTYGNCQFNIEGTEIYFLYLQECGVEGIDTFRLTKEPFDNQSERMLTGSGGTVKRGVKVYHAPANIGWQGGATSYITGSRGNRVQMVLYKGDDNLVLTLSDQAGNRDYGANGVTLYGPKGWYIVNFTLTRSITGNMYFIVQSGECSDISYEVVLSDDLIGDHYGWHKV